MKYIILLLSIASLSVLIKKINTDKKEHILIGEWLISSGGDGQTYDFIGNSLKFSKDSVRVFNNEYKTTTYQFDGKNLSWVFPGYDTVKFTVSTKYGQLNFQNEHENTPYQVENYYKFDWAVFFLLFIVGCTAIYGLYSVYSNFNVLFSSPFWPKTKVQIQKCFVEKRKGTRYKDQATASDKARYEVEDNVYFRDKLTYYSYKPVVKFQFQVNGQNVVSDNDAWHNNRSFGYDAGDSKLFVEQWSSQQGLEVKYNPKQPQQVYFGWTHFPLAMSIIIFVISAILSMALAASVEMILNSNNYQFIKLNGTTNISILFAPFVFMVYFFLSLFTNFVKKAG